MRIFFLSLIFLQMVLAFGSAQAFTLSGRVLEKGTKTPLSGASLFLEAVGNTTQALSDQDAQTEPTQAVTFSAEADSQGHYQIPVPAGLYRLTVASEGFEKKTISSLNIQGDQVLDLYLEKEGFTLPEVLVSTVKDKTEVSHEVISKEELTSVPGTAGDVIRALQTLPGVAVAGDFSGQMIVRGGGPDDNLYLLDRIPIAFPFHFGGIISTIDSDLIKTVDFSAGGFGPQYGNSWGGLIDVTQRDPRSDRWGGRVEVNMLLSEASVEGPISSDSSLAVSGRRSYLEILGNALGDFTLVPTFSDYQVKYSWNQSKNIHWDFEAFGSDDQLAYTVLPTSDLAQHDPGFAGTFEFHNGYDSQGINYRNILGDQDTLWETFYHYRFFFDTQLGNQGVHMDNSVDDFGNTFDWLHDFDPDTQFRAGVDYDHITTGTEAYSPVLPGEGQPNFDLTTAPKINALDTATFNNAGVYADQRFKLFEKKLELSIGARWDFQTNNSQSEISPRMSADYQLSDRTTLKASVGYYHQLLTQGLYPYLDPNLGNPALETEECLSEVVGWEQKLDDGLYARVEAYNKDLSNVVVSADYPVNFTNEGTGYARGVEFFLRCPPTGRFFGWVSYALSTSVRDNGPNEIHVYDYDQPDIVTLVANYKVNPGWILGLNWRYNSGMPDTPIVSSTYDPVNKRYLPVYGATNSVRLPDYQRLDVSSSFLTTYDTWQWRFYIQVINLYNHDNVIAYDYNNAYTQRKELRELPLLPYVGFEVVY